MTEPIRRRVIVRGEVQGVGFRYWTAHEAGRIGVTGQVTNLADGTVSADLEGSPDGVEELLDWFRAGGPPSARVDAVVVTEAEPTGATRFEIV